MGKRLTTQIFIERAKKIYGNKYDYSVANYKGYHDKVDIICFKHGLFSQCVSDHLNGHGCPFCAGNKKLSVKDFVKRAKKVHGDKYDYSQVDYVNNKVKVRIICPEHGEFWQTPDKHINNGQGCPNCVSNKKLTQVEFIEKAKQVHGEKYDYSKVNYINNSTKVCIIDPDYGEFWQIPNSHLLGKGCWDARADRCSDTKRKNGTYNASSLQDNMFISLLNYFDKDDVFSEYNEDERYPFHCDFYIKSKDLFIEVNGFWTHNNHWFDETNEDDIKQLNEWLYRNKSEKYGCYSGAIEVWTERDVKKREYARKNDLNYVVFWGDCQTEIDEWFNEGCPIRKDWK